MLKKLVPGATLLLLAACASTPPPPQSAAAQVTPPTGCVSDTATRLPVRPGDCAGVGSTYSKQQMDNTGQPYVGDALRMLDPSVSVHGGP
jgi:hypothetical protein